MTGIEVPEGEFYHLEVGDTEYVFASQQDAIDHLAENADTLDLDNPDVKLGRVETGDEWSIEGVAWQNIALQLLQTNE
jgi:hypothetical protein